jgi:hypothetical protein
VSYQSENGTRVGVSFRYFAIGAANRLNWARSYESAATHMDQSDFV